MLVSACERGRIRKEIAVAVAGLVFPARARYVRVRQAAFWIEVVDELDEARPNRRTRIIGINPEIVNRSGKHRLVEGSAGLVEVCVAKWPVGYPVPIGDGIAELPDRPGRTQARRKLLERTVSLRERRLVHRRRIECLKVYDAADGIHADQIARRAVQDRRVAKRIDRREIVVVAAFDAVGDGMAIDGRFGLQRADAADVEVDVVGKRSRVTRDSVVDAR